jgi:hypothetical protein
VKEVRQLDKSPEGTRELEGLQSPSGITKFYNKTFTKEKFFTVFKFMESYMDYDKSHARGKWYCRQIYGIVCTRIHLHVNWLGEEVRHRYINSRDEVMGFVKGMIISTKIFDKIGRHYFFEKPGKVPKQKGVGKTRQPLPTLGDRFHILDELPLDSESEDNEE